jgi:hypothetical protein
MQLVGVDRGECFRLDRRARLVRGRLQGQRFAAGFEGKIEALTGNRVLREGSAFSGRS